MKWIVTGMALGTLVLGGCATKEYVHEYVDGQVKPVKAELAAVDGRAQAGIAGNARRLDAVEGTLRDHEGRIAKNTEDIAELTKTAQAALERANAAGKLLEGKFVQEVVLTDDQLKFGSDKSSLGEAARLMLDDLAGRLKAENKNVYIEIQGHTDSRGSESRNLKLGEERAEAVRRYLGTKGGIPLHRMSTVSYGESQPVANNMLNEGRQQNRRVVLVVLQ